ncbi:regulatory helix-turn-helix protein, lysR family [Lentzea albida]|uniref:Regulatory helix-turn-helix protein, lysR family n=1 Tax=Lentzea albida TaxID=65499 RepID=A0A1H9S928_9PSEU|nr:regulatory helix-turn-helix protein, lysR family [Lentzea albida]
MDVRQLRYFLAVVDHGSVNKAAAVLHVAQPSLSQAIRALERDLGVDLFRRVGRRLVLADAGEALIGPARQVVRVLATARASVDEVAGLRVGRVEIAAMPSQAVEPLARIVQAVTEEHPGLSVAVGPPRRPRTSSTPSGVDGPSWGCSGLRSRCGTRGCGCGSSGGSGSCWSARRAGRSRREPWCGTRTWPGSG